MVRDIEARKRKLNERLAYRLAYETGVSLDWIKGDDVRRPAIDCLGQPYRPSEFKRRQFFLKKTNLQHGVGAWRDANQALALFLGAVGSLSTLILEAQESGRLPAFSYKLFLALETVSGTRGLRSHADLIDVCESFFPLDKVGRGYLVEAVDQFLIGSSTIRQRAFFDPIGVAKAIVSVVKRNVKSRKIGARTTSRATGMVSTLPVPSAQTYVAVPLDSQSFST
jgi:hypothetical protein